MTRGILADGKGASLEYQNRSFELGHINVLGLVVVCIRMQEKCGFEILVYAQNLNREKSPDNKSRCHSHPLCPAENLSQSVVETIRDEIQIMLAS